MRNRAAIPAAIAATMIVTVWVTACAFGGRPSWIDLGTVRRPLVVRVEDTVLRVRWPVSFTVGAVTVYAGNTPNAIDRNAPVGRTWGLTRSVHLRGLDPALRYYFELVPDSGADPVVVAERRLPIEGGDNFRDIGGYRTQDGHTVQWGLLYRSNNLADLTAKDLRYLSDLGIRLVCDFRSQNERTRDPNRTPPSAPPEVAELSVAVAGVDPTEMQERIRTGNLSKQMLEGIMLDAYRSFVTDFSDQWATMFERIADDGNLPTIVHCTAGKDRTGFASAMVLMALGVPEKTVFEDYLRTNEYRASYNWWITRLVPIYSLFRTRGEDLGPLLDARRPYLQASLDVIEEQYGSVDAYLEEGLGVTPERRHRIREIFLR